MSPRLNRIATDWKTYTVLLTAASAVLTLFTDISDKLGGLVPEGARWLAAGVLGVCAVLAMALASRRRSILLRPDRFIISPEDPEHLVGRERELKSLASICAQQRQVIMQGESGAGKTALVMAGLLNFCARKGQVLPVPVYVDASGLEWEGALGKALAKALKGLNAEQLVETGFTGSSWEPDVMTTLSKAHLGARRRLLVILDQIDDYLGQHRERLVKDNVVIATEVLREQNPDWDGLGRLVEQGVVHLLLVCRSDATAGLEALWFTKATGFMVWRIDQSLFRPILDRVTADDGKGPVIEDPSFGWDALSARLLSDLATQGGQILPVQLTVALDSMRRFPCLTLREYARQGGATGLERQHVERHVAEAGRGAGIDSNLVLRALDRLVADEGLKTVRLTVEEFRSVMLTTPQQCTALIEHLVDGRIVRKQRIEDQTYLFLHHDYLARGVRQAHRQTDYWPRLLRERHDEFERATSWWHCWRALLPVSAQWKLLVLRLRGRFTYGRHARFAWSSVLRVGPWAAAGAVLVAVPWSFVWWSRAEAAETVASYCMYAPLDRGGSEACVAFGRAPAFARVRAARKILSDSPPLSCHRARVLGHAALGIDPASDVSSSLVDEVLLPVLRSPALPLSAVAGVITELRLSPILAGRLSAALISRISYVEPLEFRDLACLGPAALVLSRNVDGDTQRALADIFVKSVTRYVPEPLKGWQSNPYKTPDQLEAESLRLPEFEQVIGKLCEMLAPADVVPLVDELIARIGVERNSPRLSMLTNAVQRLVPRLKESTPRAVDVLSNTIPVGRTSGEILKIGALLVSMSSGLPPDHRQALVAGLTQRFMAIDDPGGDRIGATASVLADLSIDLQASTLRIVSTAINLKLASGFNERDIVASALVKLNDKLAPEDIESKGILIFEQMRTATLPPFRRLAESLESIAPRLSPALLRRMAGELVDEMQRKSLSGYEVAALALALAQLKREGELSDYRHRVRKLLVANRELYSSLANKILPTIRHASGEDILKAFAIYGAEDDEAARLLMEQLVSLERKSPVHGMKGLEDTTEALSHRITAGDANRWVTDLATPLISGNEHFKGLGQIAQGLAHRMDAAGSERLVVQLHQKMQDARGESTFSRFVWAAGKLGCALPSTKLRIIAELALERMKDESIGSVDLATLANHIANLGVSPDRDIVDRAAMVVLERLEQAADMTDVAYLSSSIELLAKHLDPKGTPLRRVEEALAHPLAVGNRRGFLLRAIGACTSQDFGDDLWRYVAWSDARTQTPVEGGELFGRTEAIGNPRSAR